MTVLIISGEDLARDVRISEEVWNCAGPEISERALAALSLGPASRQQWAELPFDWICVPCLDGPLLVFRERDDARARGLQELIFEQWAVWRKSAEPTKRIAIARQVRRWHLQRVALAIGYWFPGVADDCFVEFAPDE